MATTGGGSKEPLNMGVSDIWRGRQGPAAGVVLRAAHIYCAHAAAPMATIVPDVRMPTSTTYVR